MIPIVTIPQSQVTSVNMSPCENYVMTYSATGDNPYTVWNFKMLEIIRTLPYGGDEDETTYQWSHNGNFIAKKFRTEIANDEKNTTKVKEGISVYSLPSMEMIARSDGQKKSITIGGIKDWMWVPGKNLIAYSCFFGTEELNDEDEAYEEKKSKLMDPKIGFISIPNRAVVQTFTFNDSLELRFYMHSKGKYLGVVNQQRGKKGSKNLNYSIEVFDLKTDSIPHQKIFYKKNVISFTGLYWDIKNDMLALHSLDRKEAS